MLFFGGGGGSQMCYVSLIHELLFDHQGDDIKLILKGKNLAIL